MSIYVKVLNGAVVNSMVADEAFFETFIDTSPGEWLLTDYNTRGNVHYGDNGEPDGGIPFRGNYANIGYSYDSVNDVFIPPKPYPSWVINPQTWLWEAPVPYPDDGQSYIWDEATLSWVLFPN